MLYYNICHVKFDCIKDNNILLRNYVRVRHRSYQNDWSIRTVFSYFIDPSGSHTVIRRGTYNAEAN